MALGLVLLILGIRGLHIQSVSEYEKEAVQLAGQLEIEETTDVEQKVTEAGPENSGQPAMTSKKEKPKEDTRTRKKSAPKSDTGSGAKSTPKADKKKELGTDTGTEKKKAPEPDAGSDKKSVARADMTERKKDTIQCTISIRCDALKEKRETLEEGLLPYVPEDGIILSAVKVKVAGKSSVYDVLSAVCKAKNIALDAEYTPFYDSYYVRGINHLYEMDAGDRSGWLYTVNGKKPDVGASACKLSDGDRIIWSYSCDGTI